MNVFFIICGIGCYFLSVCFMLGVWRNMFDTKKDCEIFALLWPLAGLILGAGGVLEWLLAHATHPFNTSLAKSLQAMGWKFMNRWNHANDD